jgi:hypothetical protein
MKGVAGVAAVGLAVVGLGFGIRAMAASGSPSLPVVYGFAGASGWQHPGIQPPSVNFGAGGSLLIRGLRWASWGHEQAIAHGSRWADNCVPNCAQGKYAKVPAELTLSGVRLHDGVRYYSKLTTHWKVNGQPVTNVFTWAPGSASGASALWSWRIAEPRGQLAPSEPTPQGQAR